MESDEDSENAEGSKTEVDGPAEGPGDGVKKEDVLYHIRTRPWKKPKTEKSEDGEED